MSGTTLTKYDHYLTERNRNVASGAISILLLVALTTVGVKASFGAFDGGYKIQGSFAAAGQGLIDGSDVKIRGVNVGEVSDIQLVENRALITMRIEDGTEIPLTAQAVIRPKTLFGEKFVDIIPGDGEDAGPFIRTEPVDPGCPRPDIPCVLETLGGFELEQVLADAYPVLEAIDPAELATVVDELATAADGMGETINRTLVNGAVVAETSVSNDAEFRQFTSDLALLSETLDRVAPSLVAGAEDLNVALPTLIENSDDLNEALVQLGRIGHDLADVLEANKAFTDNALSNGSKTLQVVFDRRGQLQPLLLGLTHYAETIAKAIRYEVGDGSLMAAVKNVANVEHAVTGQSASSGASTPGAGQDAGPADGLVGDVTDSAAAILSLVLGGRG